VNANLGFRSNSLVLFAISYSR